MIRRQLNKMFRALFRFTNRSGTWWNFVNGQYITKLIDGKVALVHRKETIASFGGKEEEVSKSRVQQFILLYYIIWIYIESMYSQSISNNARMLSLCYPKFVLKDLYCGTVVERGIKAKNKLQIKITKYSPLLFLKFIDSGLFYSVAFQCSGTGRFWSLIRWIILPSLQSRRTSKINPLLPIQAKKRTKSIF